MKWIRHDTNASQDPKIRKLLIKHGAVGYAVYFHCLELISGAFSHENPSVQLQEDSEIIADNLKISGTGSQSGSEFVESIMRTLVHLSLFEEIDGKIFCGKLIHRMDQSMTGNLRFRKLISEAKKSHDPVMTQSCQSHDPVMNIELELEQELELEPKEERKSGARAPAPTRPRRKPDLRLGECQNILLTSEEYQRLCEEHTQELVDESVHLMSLWKEEKGKRVKNDNLALRRWAIDAAIERRQRVGSKSSTKPKIDWDAYVKEISDDTK